MLRSVSLLISLIHEISMFVTWLQGLWYALNEQLSKFNVLDSHRTAIKTSELAPPKNFYRFAISMNIIIHSDKTLYIADIGIDVIIIIISVAQQRKPKFSPMRNSHRSNYWPSQNIPFFQNAASPFLIYTIIRSILTLFTNCQHI